MSSVPVTLAAGTSTRVFPLAYGWFAAVVRSGQLIALAHEHGLRHESAPNARLVLQHALALQWLIEGGDAAVDAVENNGRRRMFDLVKELNDSNWPLPSGFTAPVGAPPKKGGQLEHQFDNFKAMCELYENGLQTYVPYKLQSSNAHPSYAGARAYMNPDVDGELSTTAVTDTYAHLVDSARCVIQAGIAFAPLLDDGTLREAVTEAQAVLGINFGLWKRCP